MATKIENLTGKPLWLRLNSGESLVIAAHKLSRELGDHEVQGNTTIDKLAERRIVVQHPPASLSATEDKGEPRAHRRREAGPQS